MIFSNNDDKATFYRLVPAAVVIFEVVSKAVPGFFNTLVAIFFTSFSGNPSQIFEKN